MNLFKRATMVAMLLAATGAAFAQAFPNKPIRIIVPYPAGGSIDMSARMIGEVMSRKLGQPVLVDNRPGASGNIGMDYVAKSPADGYTLLMASASLTANGHLFTKLTYDPIKAFAPVVKVADQPNVLIVNPSLGVKNVAELVALAKQKPGVLTYGSAGPGSTQHISAMIFMNQTGTSMLHVPYKGGAPALADLVGGQIDMMFETSPTAVPFVTSGKLLALGVTTPKRVDTLPAVPTLAEAGAKNYDYYGWIGMTAPAGTPAAVIDKLNAVVAEAVKGELRGKFAEISLMPVGDTPAEFGAFMQKDYAVYGKIVKEANIVLD